LPFRSSENGPDRPAVFGPWPVHRVYTHQQALLLRNIHVARQPAARNHMTPLRKILTSFVLVGTLTVSGVACSKSTDSAKTSDTGTADTSTSDTGKTSDTGASDPGETPTTASTPSGSTSDWCKQARQYDEESKAEDESIDFNDSDAMISAFEEVSDELDDIAKGAPKEIRSDLQLLADTNREMAAAMRSGGWEELNAMEGDDALAAAGERIDIYLRDVCGIEVDG
jgi:hypothetical protein